MLVRQLFNSDYRAWITKDSYDFGAEWLREFDPAGLPMPPEHLVRGAPYADRGTGHAAHPHTGVVS